MFPWRETRYVPFGNTIFARFAGNRYEWPCLFSFPSVICPAIFGIKIKTEAPKPGHSFWMKQNESHTIFKNLSQEQTIWFSVCYVVCPKRAAKRHISSKAKLCISSKIHRRETNPFTWSPGVGVQKGACGTPQRATKWHISSKVSVAELCISSGRKPTYRAAMGRISTIIHRRINQSFLPLRTSGRVARRHPPAYRHKLIAGNKVIFPRHTSGRVARRRCRPPFYYYTR